MKRELTEILREIREQKERRGYAVQPGCSEGEIKILRDAIARGFHVSFPESYQELLRQMNGIDFNGTLIFAAYRTPHASRPGKFIEGLLDANKVRRANAPDFLIIGESGMEMYVHNLLTEKWEIIDQVSLDAFETFEAMDDLLVSALGKRLART